MKKTLLTFVLILSVNLCTQAQHRLGISVGPAIVNSKAGFGFSGHYRYVIKNVRLGFNAGYYSINSYNILPVTASAEYYFSGKVAPYLGADFGVYSHTGGTNLGIAPTGGLQFPVTKNMAFQVNFKYHVMLSDGATNYIGLNAGLYFKL